MIRYCLMLSSLWFLSCTQAPVEDAARAQIIPHGDSDWYVGWSHTKGAQIDGKWVDTTQPTILSGQTSHQIRYGGALIHVPARVDDRCRTIKMVVLGDGRASVDGVGPSAYWPGLLREVQAHQPEVILNSGDLVKNGKSPDEWNHFFRLTPTQPPMVMVRGNHDRGELFDLHQIAPSTVFWFRLGPVLVVAVDSEIALSELDPMLDKVAEIFASQPSDWRILLMHRPIWSRGNHGSDERKWNHRWVPVIDQAKVDLVIAGHDHNYERFCRQMGLEAQRRCTQHEGTVYLVSGGAATFTNPVPGVARDVPSQTKQVDALMSRRFSGSKHYVVLEASPHALSLKAIKSRTGNFGTPGVIDTFTLPKKGSRCP